MFAPSKANAYAQVGMESGVQTATPHKLVLMLFDGAIMALAMALSNMVQHKVAEKGRSISHAIDIITNGLRASLDVEAGGEMAERMYALYEYMGTRLVIANANNDAAPIEEVTHLLSELRSAWEEIADDPAVVSANRVAS